MKKYIQVQRAAPFNNIRNKRCRYMDFKPSVIVF